MSTEFDFYTALAKRWNMPRKQAKTLWIQMWYTATSIESNPNDYIARAALEKVWR